MSLEQKRGGASFSLEIKRANGHTATFNSFDTLRSTQGYFDITALRIKCSDNEEIPDLPPELQILTVDLSKIRKLPTLPYTLSVIQVTRSKLEVFPKIDTLPFLESLSLHDCYLENVSKFPDNLRTVDLSYNKIEQIDWTMVNRGLIEIDVSFNKLRQVPPGRPGLTIHCHHNNFSNSLAFRRVIEDKSCDAKYPTGKKEDSGVGVYGNGENVHLQSIQKSAADSLRIIMSLCPNRKINRRYVQEIEALYSKGGCCGSKATQRRLETAPPIRVWCNDTTFFTEQGVRYGYLLERVWCYISSKWCWSTTKRQLIKILKQELEASNGLCMTGLFTRTISVLSGFVEGVDVGVSERERLQERIAFAVTKTRDKYGENHELFLRMARLTVNDILIEMNVPADEKQDWLDAIE